MTAKPNLLGRLAHYDQMIYDIDISHQFETKMSRILVDLPEAQLEQLAALVEAEQRPRAAIIRDAIDSYLALHKRMIGSDVFGLWKRKKLDGLAYQEELRSEW